jgi:hypothetical protein
VVLGGRNLICFEFIRLFISVVCPAGLFTYSAQVLGHTCNGVPKGAFIVHECVYANDRLWLEGSLGTRLRCFAVIRGFSACYIYRNTGYYYHAESICKVPIYLWLLRVFTHPHRICPDLGISLLLCEQWAPGVYSTPPAECSYNSTFWAW